MSPIGKVPQEPIDVQDWDIGKSEGHAVMV